MTQNEKLIALAELEGWKFSNEDHDENGNLNFAGLYHPTKKGGRPPYLTSHDAQQPLLEKMTEEEWANYFPALARMTGAAIHSAPLPYEIRMHLATPEQKADAILKAYGKWKEQA